MDAVSLAFVAEPEVDGGGVVDDGIVYAGLEGLVGFDVVVNFDVGSVPDIVPAAGVGGEFFDDIPVVIVVEFVAVAPEVEHPVLGSVAGLFLHEFPGSIHQVRTFVMVGGVEGQPVFGEAERFCGFGGAAIADAAGFQGFQHRVAVGAVGIGHPPGKRAVLGFDLPRAVSGIPGAFQIVFHKESSFGWDFGSI